MSKTYAGIGSRRTPQDVLVLMEQVAAKLRMRGFVLRSGHADGADSAFEHGAAGVAEIFLPWPKFNGSGSSLCSVSPAALKLASEYHPRWAHLSQGAQKLHARNCFQVLGRDLVDPVRFVLCWHDGSGGTMQAVRIAESRGIPVFNLRDADVRARLEAFVNE